VNRTGNAASALLDSIRRAEEASRSRAEERATAADRAAQGTVPLHRMRRDACPDCGNTHAGNDVCEAARDPRWAEWHRATLEHVCLGCGKKYGDHGGICEAVNTRRGKRAGETLFVPWNDQPGRKPHGGA